MKTDIHPQYFKEAHIRCSCGNIIVVGATKESMRVELCSACHPFFTGQQKLVDTAGRVDRFEEKRKKAELMQQAKREAQMAKKIKSERRFEEKRPVKMTKKKIVKKK